MQAHRVSGTDATLDDSPAEAAAATGHWQHFLLFESVGAGAFGTVYRAWDTKVDREVALKLVSTGATQPIPAQRGTPPRPHPAPQHRHGLRRRTGLRTGRHLDGIHPGRDARPDGARPRSDERARGRRHRRGSLPRAVRAAGSVAAASRHQGAQRDARSGRPDRPDGLQRRLDVGCRRDPREPCPARRCTWRRSSSRTGRRVWRATSTVWACCCSTCWRAGCRSRDHRSPSSRTLMRAACVRGCATCVPNFRTRSCRSSNAPRLTTRASATRPLENSSTPWSARSGLMRRCRRRPPPLPRPAMRTSRTGWVTWASVAVAALAVAALAMDGSGRTTADADPLPYRFLIGLPENTGSWPRLSPDGRKVVYGTTVEGRDRVVGARDG